MEKKQIQIIANYDNNADLFAMLRKVMEQIQENKKDCLAFENESNVSARIK